MGGYGADHIAGLVHGRKQAHRVIDAIEPHEFIVIGGIGSIRGALVGALLVGTVETIGRAFAPALLKQFMPPALVADTAPALAGMTMYLLMVAVLFFKPRGLFPTRG